MWNSTAMAPPKSIQKKIDRRLLKGDAKTPVKQVAALCYRVTKSGKLKVLLVTSRRTRRWIIPKGWPMRNQPDHKAAAREAYEEAGIRGKVRNKPVGKFTYRKLLSAGKSIRCRVQVFELRTAEIKDIYPESDQRQRRWFSPKKAANRISDRQVGPIILALARKFQDKKSKGLNLTNP